MEVSIDEYGRIVILKPKHGISAKGVPILPVKHGTQEGDTRYGLL